MHISAKTEKYQLTEAAILKDEEENPLYRVTTCDEDKLLDAWIGPKGCKFQTRGKGRHSYGEESDVTQMQQSPTLPCPLGA